MIKEVTVTAETIEEAEQKAREQLGRDEINVEVLQQPEKKKFGLFGGNPAKIRAYIELAPVDCAKEYLEDILGKMGISGCASYFCPDHSKRHIAVFFERILTDWPGKSRPATS